VQDIEKSSVGGFDQRNRNTGPLNTDGVSAFHRQSFLPIERQNDVLTLRRGFRIGPGERALVVEDVITTGGSTRETMDVVRQHGGIVVGVGSIIDRSGGDVDLGVTRVALATLSIPTYQADNCPLCKSGSTAVKPGSRN